MAVGQQRSQLNATIYRLTSLTKQANSIAVSTMMCSVMSCQTTPSVTALYHDVAVVSRNHAW